MDEQRQDDELEPIYNSSVLIRDVALKTYQERWTIETSGRSMLMARHDDDDNDILRGLKLMQSKTGLCETLNQSWRSAIFTRVNNYAKTLL